MSKIYVLVTAGGYVSCVTSRVHGGFNSREDAMRHAKSIGIYPRGDKTWDDYIHELFMNPKEETLYHLECRADLYREIDEEDEDEERGEYLFCPRWEENVAKGVKESCSNTVTTLDYSSLEMRPIFTSMCDGDAGYITIDCHLKEKPTVATVIEIIKTKAQRVNNGIVD